jgi:hypothetical protein
MDKFLNTLYNKQKYNCFHFASDVWQELTGRNSLKGSFHDMRKKFQRISRPVNPCVVIFSGGRETHVGIYFDNLVMHLNESGVTRERLNTVSLGFKKVSYYKEKV